MPETDDPNKRSKHSTSVGRAPEALPPSRDPLHPPKTPEIIAEEARIAAFEAAAWSEVRALAAQIDGTASAPPHVSLWLLEAGGARTDSSWDLDGKSGSSSPAVFVHRLQELAQAANRTPICLIHLRPVVRTAKAVLKRTASPAQLEDEAKLKLARTKGWGDKLRELASALDDQKDQPFQVLIEAEAAYLRNLDLPAPPGESTARAVESLTSQWLDRRATDVIRLVSMGEVDLFVILTTFHPGWQRRRMRDPVDRSKVQAAAKQLLDAAEKLELSGPALGLDADLTRIQTAWEVARTEVKGRLEAVIEKLSKQELSTFEEKRDLASVLVQVMERWGFQALSPETGNPASLRVRQSTPDAKGKFQFDERPVPGSQAPVSQRSPRGGKAQLPAFKLVDKPTDGRRRVPN